MALLDGGSIHLELEMPQGKQESIKLDKEMGSPTEGRVFATMLNPHEPLSEQEEQQLLTILQNQIANREEYAWHLQIIESHLSGSESLPDESEHNIAMDDLLQNE